MIVTFDDSEPSSTGRITVPDKMVSALKKKMEEGQAHFFSGHMTGFLIIIFFKIPDLIIMNLPDRDVFHCEADCKCLGSESSKGGLGVLQYKLLHTCLST